MKYHVRVTVKNSDGTATSYIPAGGNYSERGKAIESASFLYQTTKDVVMVEVFENGIAQPIAFFS